MKQRAIEPADLFRLKFIGAASLSPDGKQVAYTVMHTDTEKGKDFTAIWLVSTQSGKARQLTSGTSQDNNPQWSPDGSQIAFISPRNEKPQIFVIPVDGGEARQITTLKQGVGGGPVWSPDGTQIAFTASTVVEPRDFSKPYRVDRFVYRFNEMEYLDDVVQSVYVTSADGGEARQLTNDRLMNANPQWSPDGKELLYMAAMSPDAAKVFFPSLRIINLESGKTRDVLEGWGEIQAASWTPDGQIVFAGQVSGKTIGSKSDLWVASASGKGGKPKNRTSKLEAGVAGGLQADMPVYIFSQTILVSKDGSSAYHSVQVGGTVQIYRIALDGKEDWEAVVSGDRTCMLAAVGENSLAYIVSTLHTPTDLYVARLDGTREKQLTAINDDVLAELILPKVEQMLFPGSDGVQVEGWAVMPPKGKKLPTVLYIHGGPHGAFGHIFHFDTLMLCGAGYAVLLINHRASTGYGDAFSTAIKGDWGNLDYHDLMAGVDEAIARGIADPKRLGVCGLSGGGNLSCWIVGQTDRFKAAVPENPVTNWVSFYGVSDIGVWFSVEELGGHPHEIPEIYAKCSPITYAHRCKTPTLMVQGEHDWRCPLEQGEQFYTVLKANGCPVEMLRLPGAAHGGTINGAFDNRRVHNEALLDWMNRWVLGKKS